MPALARRRALALGAAAVLGPALPSAYAQAAATALPLLGPLGPPGPLLEGMGEHPVADVSDNAMARRWMAQGMVLAWGFNPAEAARSFAGALAADPHCAAAAWGLAWALGPTVNTDTAPADAPRLHAALQRAQALAPQAAPRWRALIAALARRHPTAGAVAADDAAYERAMQATARQFPRDADVLTLAAEASMNLHPYDWWRAQGQPQPWTPAIARRLRQALAVDSGHVGANHLWVHLMETSPRPELALAAANRLRDAVPGSGHLQHMPAHIYLRTGRLAEATAANLRAVAADQRYLAQVDAQRAYRVGYVAHNHHFLWATAAMQGHARLALEAADAAYPAACGSAGDDGSGTLQHYRALPMLARLRFARWDEALHGVPPPDGNHPYPLALWHYGRGTAYAHTGRVDEARRALAELRTLAALPATAATRIKQVHPATALLAIAGHSLAADIAWRSGQADAAVTACMAATALEDSLHPDEPHVWLAPTRHALAAALLAAGRCREAVRVLRADLAHYPENGWSLAGLLRAQRATGADTRDTARRLAAAWQHADVPPDGPRLGVLAACA